MLNGEDDKEVKTIQSSGGEENRKPSSPSSLEFISVQKDEVVDTVQIQKEPLTQPNAIHGRSLSRGTQSKSSAECICAQAAHPTAALFHLLFQGIAICLYIAGGIIFSQGSFIFFSVLIILFLAADFWNVKNISGRLLVGLRWWSSYDPITGQQSWRFENRDEDVSNGKLAPDTTASFDDADGSKAQQGKAVDSRIFWFGLYGEFIIWSFLAIIAFLKFNFDWLMIDVIALSLIGANISGYLKCKNFNPSQAASSMSTMAMLASAAGGGTGSVARNAFGALTTMASVAGPSNNSGRSRDDPGVIV
jgi:hypothetical protein